MDSQLVHMEETDPQFGGKELTSGQKEPQDEAFKGSFSHLCSFSYLKFRHDGWRSGSHFGP